MSFKDVAIKNFKLNMQKFFSYFLCSSFSIMIFFIYATLLFNKNLSNKADGDSVNIIFYISLTALALFAVFFINYAHSAFMKSRNKEFGVYLTLGMNYTDLRRLVNVENAIIILSSLIAGLLSGLLFSRIFQMVVLKLLNISGVKYSLNYKSFLLTISVFAVIFALVIILSSLQIKKLDISDLLKDSKKKQGKDKASLLGGLIGILILILSFIMLIIICKHEKLRNNTALVIAYILISFTGAYVTISYIGSAVISLVKYKSYYYRNILFITEINHKFTQNKRIIFVLSILSAMTITLGASPFALYNLVDSIVEMNSNTSIVYAKVGDINNISTADFNNIIKKTDSKIESVKNIEFISLALKGDKEPDDIIKSKPIVSESIYNNITGSNLHLNKGEAFNVVTAWVPGNHGLNPNDKISFTDGLKEFNFTIKNSAHIKWVADSEAYASNSGIVISNEDYSYLKNIVTSKNLGVFKSVKYSNWKKSEISINALVDKLNKSNKSLKDGDKKISSLFIVSSTLGRYKTLKQGYSFFIFVTTIMGILFFIAGGSVLFFKKYTEINDDRERIFKLYKIGINEKEAIGVIAKELRLIFFTPLIMGSILGYSFMYLLTFMVGGGDIIKEFMIKATYVIIVYFLFQAAFYYITKRKYKDMILPKE